MIEKLGFPKDNQNYDMKGLISAILTNKQPNKPEVSDLSDTSFSLINEDDKAVVTTLQDNGVILYSNIVIVTKKEAEELSKALMTKLSYVVYEDDNYKVVASFVIPDKAKLKTKIYRTVDLDEFESYAHSYDIYKMFSLLDQHTKGLYDVSLEDKDTGMTETLSVFDVMSYIQRN